VVQPLVEGGHRQAFVEPVREHLARFGEQPGAGEGRDAGDAV